MRTRPGRRFAPVAACILCAAIGCTRADKPVPVRGVLTLDGNPVEGAAVQFVPASDTARPAHAETGSGGSYQIMTREPGDGAMPGEYRVLVIWEPPPPPTYRTSGEGGPSRQQMQRDIEEYQAKQKKLGKGVTIPPVYGEPGKTPLRVTVPAPGGKADFALSSKP